MAYAPGFSSLEQGPTVDLLMVKGQTITLQPPAGLVYGGAPVPLMGSSDTGLALSYKVTDGLMKIRIYIKQSARNVTM